MGRRMGGYNYGTPSYGSSFINVSGASNNIIDLRNGQDIPSVINASGASDVIVEAGGGGFMPGYQQGMSEFQRGMSEFQRGMQEMDRVLGGMRIREEIEDYPPVREKPRKRLPPPKNPFYRGDKEMEDYGPVREKPRGRLPPPKNPFYRGSENDRGSKDHGMFDGRDRSEREGFMRGGTKREVPKRGQSMIDGPPPRGRKLIEGPPRQGEMKREPSRGGRMDEPPRGRMPAPDEPMRGGWQPRYGGAEWMRRQGGVGGGGTRNAGPWRWYWNEDWRRG